MFRLCPSVLLDLLLRDLEYQRWRDVQDHVKEMLDRLETSGMFSEEHGNLAQIKSDPNLSDTSLVPTTQFNIRYCSHILDQFPIGCDPFSLI
jgi:hypothetical protein